jgi:hypothetical protein
MCHCVELTREMCDQPPGFVPMAEKCFPSVRWPIYELDRTKGAGQCEIAFSTEC